MTRRFLARWGAILAAGCVTALPLAACAPVSGPDAVRGGDETAARPSAGEPAGGQARPGSTHGMPASAGELWDALDRGGLPLQDLRGIAGTVRGEASPGTLIALHLAKRLDAVRYETAGPEGGFDFDEVPAGSYYIAYHPPTTDGDPPPTVLRRIVVQADLASAAPAPLEPGAYRLRVEDARGPLPGAPLALLGPLAEDGRGARAAATLEPVPPEELPDFVIFSSADASSTLVLPLLPAGRYELSSDRQKASLTLPVNEALVVLEQGD